MPFDTISNKISICRKVVNYANLRCTHLILFTRTLHSGFGRNSWWKFEGRLMRACGRWERRVNMEEMTFVVIVKYGEKKKRMYIIPKDSTFCLHEEETKSPPPLCHMSASEWVGQKNIQKAAFGSSMKWKKMFFLPFPWRLLRGCLIVVLSKHSFDSFFTIFLHNFDSKIKIKN